MSKIATLNEMPKTESGFMYRLTEGLGVKSFGLTIERFPENSGDEFYPAHDHKDDGIEEVYLCLEGSGEVRFGESDWTPIQEGSLIKVEPAESRQFRSGSEGMSLLAVGRPETGDYTAPQWASGQGEPEMGATTGSGEPSSGGQSGQETEAEHTHSTQTGGGTGGEAA